MARARDLLEEELAGVVPLVPANGGGVRPRAEVVDLGAWQSHMAALEAQIAASEQRTAERLKALEDRVAAAEVRLDQAMDELRERSRELHAQMMGLAERIKRLETD